MIGWRIPTAGLMLLAAVACNPQRPAGEEPPAPARPEPTAKSGAVTVPAEPVPEQPAAEEPAPVGPEPLALRFVSPNLGPPAGGNDVTLDGRGFAEYPRIAFGGVQAWIRSVTPTEIRVTVPPPETPVAAGDTLVVDVRVMNPPEGSRGPMSETLVRAYSYVGAAADPPAVDPAADASEQPPATAAADPPPATAQAAPPQTLIASFSFEILDPSGDCPPPGTRVRFADRSTGGVTEWWWDFGDGSNSKDRLHEHCYEMPGMRSVNLTVSNSVESASTSKIVTASME